MILHSQDKPFKCTYCEEHFKSRFARLKHQEKFHLGKQVIFLGASQPLLVSTSCWGDCCCGATLEGSSWSGAGFLEMSKHWVCFVFWWQVCSWSELHLFTVDCRIGLWVPGVCIFVCFRKPSFFRECSKLSILGMQCCICWVLSLLLVATVETCVPDRYIYDSLIPVMDYHHPSRLFPVLFTVFIDNLDKR